MKKQVLIIVLFTFFLFTAANADNMSFSYQFNQPTVSNNQISSDLEYRTQNPGEPVIPYFTTRILLPYGHKITKIQTQHSNWKTIAENIEIKWAPEPRPLSLSSDTPTPRNKKIYSTNLPYPRQTSKLSSSNYACGYKIAFIKIFPYRYLPKTGLLQIAKNWQLEITTKFNQKIAEHQSQFLSNEHELNLSINNPHEVNSYLNQEAKHYTSKGIVTPDDPHDYIIITSNDFVSTFEPFRDWKNSSDLDAKIYTTSEIYSNYSGQDEQAKIRNFIMDAYLAWSTSDTPLQYVLLGGDDEIIPDRKLYGQVGGTVGYIPSDFYFSEFDSDWDSNGNGIYGEYPADNVDFIPEVAIGRISADTETGFNNSLNKIISYKENLQPALEIACMVGENLNWNPVTWGGDYKDDVRTRIPANNYHFTTLYQRDGTYSGSAVYDMINSGCGIMNHMGHSNYNILMGMNPITPDQFTNTGYGLIYTQGCYPGAFDEETSHTGESVGERLQIAEAGPMAFVGNTRYGWYSPGSIEGASQQFDRTFFDGLFTENITNLGDCNNYSKTELIPNMDSGVMRWCFYELTLFGDPHTEIITLDGVFPMLEPAELIYNDDLGDGDGNINPGETIQMFVNIKNLTGWETAHDVVLTMQNSSDDIIISDSTSSYGTVQPGTQVSNPTDPIEFQVSTTSGYDNINYSLKITANPDSNYSFNKTFSKTIDVNIDQTNWPVYVGSTIKCAPSVLDFDDDGANELLVNDALGKIIVLTAEGNNENNFPLNLQEEIWGSLAIGDINGNSHQEIIVNTIPGKIFAINDQGSIMFEFDTNEQIISTPSLYDLNNDGTLEIITSTINGKLFILNSDGENFGDFPYNLGEAICTDPALGDIDQDGEPDIIIGTLSGSVYAINAEADILNGFPFHSDAQICASPIIFAQDKVAFSNYDNKLIILDGAGSLLVENSYDAKIPSSMLAFQNFDENYRVAFNLMNGSMGLINPDGNYLSGWPQTLNATTQKSPVAVDLNNDNVTEIIASTMNGTFHSYNQAGEAMPYFPIESNHSIESPLTIADIDSDDDFEIIAGGSTSILAWDFKEQRGAKTPWSMFRGNLHRTGNLAHNHIYGIDDPVLNPDNAQLFQNYPNPFRTQTTFSFSLKQPGLDNARINIYNIKGQLIKTLESTCAGTNMSSSAKQTITWDGTNDFGHRISNGIYFYKLLTKNSASQVKRLIFMK